MNRKVLVALPVALALTASAVPVATAGPTSAHDNIITKRLSGDRMMDHVETLSIDIGPRVASSPEEEQAADYIAQTLSGYGYDVEIQEFPYANTVGYATLDGERLLVRVGGSSPVTSVDGVTGPVVDAGLGHPEDFPADTAGSIALIQRGEVAFTQMIANAEAAGAVGVMIANNGWNIFSANVPGAAIPFVTMNDEAGDIVRSASEGTVTLEVNRYESSQNVVATLKPRSGRHDTGEITTFVAHYDSVPASPGANDNATGTASMLELARAYSALPLATEVRFIAAGAEEVGLRGARHYVNELSEDEIDRIVANFDMDMTGTAGEAQTTLYVNTLDGDNLVSQQARAAADRLGYASLINAPFHRGSSDHVPFHDVGIPAANHIWREPGTHALEPWYHTPHDTIEHVSQERLLVATQIVGASSYSVARPERPNQ